MVGILLALFGLAFQFLIGTSLVVAVQAALGFLLRWYILWGVLGLIYAITSIVIATIKDYQRHGLVSAIGMFFFSIVLAALVWAVSCGAHIFGAIFLLVPTSSFPSIPVSLTSLAIGSLTQALILRRVFRHF